LRFDVSALPIREVVQAVGDRADDVELQPRIPPHHGDQ